MTRTALAEPRKRKPDTGLIRPYRPKPSDFLETFARMGWDGIDEHYRTNWRVIRRWYLEEGEDRCDQARYEWRCQHGVRVPRKRPTRNRRAAYVIGTRLPPAYPPDWDVIPVGAQLNLEVIMGDQRFTIPAQRKPLHVTDHALVRYLERVKGIDMDLIRAELASPTAHLAEAFGASHVILKTGERALIRDGCVQTVLPKRKGGR